MTTEKLTSQRGNQVLLWGNWYRAIAEGQLIFTKILNNMPKVYPISRVCFKNKSGILAYLLESMFFLFPPFLRSREGHAFQNSCTALSCYQHRCYCPFLVAMKIHRVRGNGNSEAGAKPCWSMFGWIAFDQRLTASTYSSTHTDVSSWSRKAGRSAVRLPASFLCSSMGSADGTTISKYGFAVRHHWNGCR